MSTLIVQAIVPMQPEAPERPETSTEPPKTLEVFALALRVTRPIVTVEQASRLFPR